MGGDEVLQDDKELVAQQSDQAPGEEKFSYGKRFSQTEELYTVRQMNRELEELARHDGMLDDEDEAPLRVTAELPEPPDGMHRGAPIGALPPLEEPPPRDRLAEVFDDAQRYIRMIRDGVRDVRSAARRLARLPFEAAQLAASKIRPVRA